MSKAVTFHATIDGKRWRIAAIHGAPARRWAWLVNIDRPREQVRLSMNRPELAQYKNPTPPMVFTAQNHTHE